MTFPELLHKLVDKVPWFTESEREDAHAAVEAEHPPAEGEPSIHNKAPDDGGRAPEVGPAPAPPPQSDATGGVSTSSAASDAPAEASPEEAEPEPEPSEPEPSPDTTAPAPESTGGVSPAVPASEVPAEPTPAPAPPPTDPAELAAENERLRAMLGVGQPASGVNAGVVDVPQAPAS